MVFSRLKELYKKESHGKTPLEDFTTEILIGILEEDSNLRNRYVEEVLKIENDGSDFKIESQKRYILDDKGIRNICYIDLVISNKNIVCFQENKVNSKEGEGHQKKQLTKYDEILQNIEGRTVYLRYCTKRYDPKDNKAYKSNFKYFRWFDVYSFLEKNCNENQQIIDFLIFMEENNMSKFTDFTFQDIACINSLESIFNKFNEIFDDSILALISEIFNKKSTLCYEKGYPVIDNSLTYRYKDLLAVCRVDKPS